MHLSPRDRRELFEAADNYLASKCPLSSAERHGPATFNRALHVELGGMDLYGQFAPEEVGGLGLGLVAAHCVAEAAGHNLAPGTILDQMCAVYGFLDDADVCADFIAGHSLVSAVFRGSTALSSDEMSVSGEVSGVRFGGDTDRWMLQAVSPYGPASVLLDRVVLGDAPEIEPWLDPNTLTYRAALDSVPVSHVSRQPLSVADFAKCLSASYSVGAAMRVLEIAVQYVMVRTQFNRPLGSFQAVKHRAANAYSAIVHARATAEAAYASLEKGLTDSLPSVARISADRCYRGATEAALQMHGGIGFTTEADVHLFLKNAQHMRLWPMPAFAEVDALMARLGLGNAVETTTGSRDL